MIPTLTHSAIYDALAGAARKGYAQRQLAYCAAGWISMFGVKPQLPPRQRPTHLSTLLIASVLVVIAMMVLSAILSAIQPMLIAVGGLTMERTVVGLLISFFGWRYLIGRHLIRSVIAFQDANGQGTHVGT